MRRAIIAISNGLDVACQSGAIAFFAAMLVFVSIQVIARYILQSPPTWTEELARYAMVWGGLLGSTMAFKARFDPVLIKPPGGDSPGLSAAAAFVRFIAVSIFMAPVLYYSLFGPNMNLARGFLGRSLGRTADTLGFPMIYVAAAVPVAAFVILVHLVARVAGDRTFVVDGDAD